MEGFPDGSSGSYRRQYWMGNKVSGYGYEDQMRPKQRVCQILGQRG